MLRYAKFYLTIFLLFYNFNLVYSAAEGPTERLLDLLSKSQPDIEPEELNLLIKKLLHRGASLKAKNISSYTALHLAACNHSVEVIKILLDAKADPNCKDEHGCTPLFFVQKIDEAKILLRYKADINIVNAGGNTPIFNALFVNSNEPSDCLKLYLSHGVNKINQTRSDGFGLLHEAAKCNYDQAIKLLLDYQADIDVPDNSGNTPLIVAINNKHESCVRVLLDYWANIENVPKINLVAEEPARRTLIEQDIKVSQISKKILTDDLNLPVDLASIIQDYLISKKEIQIINKAKKPAEQITSPAL